MRFSQCIILQGILLRANISWTSWTEVSDLNVIGCKGTCILSEGMRLLMQNSDQLGAALQIEIGQLDSTIAVSNLPLGNMSYWFEGSSIVITMNLTSGMISKPLGIFVNKTTAPTAPPAQLNTQVSAPLTQLMTCAPGEQHAVHISGYTI